MPAAGDTHSLPKTAKIKIVDGVRVATARLSAPTGGVFIVISFAEHKKILSRSPRLRPSFVQGLSIQPLNHPRSPSIIVIRRGHRLSWPRSDVEPRIIHGSDFWSKRILDRSVMDTDEATHSGEDSPVSELQPAPPAQVSPATEAVPDTPTSLEAALEKGVSEIRSEIRQRAESDRFRERQIEQLHAEVQAYRAGLIQQEAQQLMLGLVRLHDDVGKTVEALQKRPPADLSPELCFVKLTEFQDDIELLLAQHGAERFEIPGDAFDPQRQTALRTVADPDIEKNGTLAFRIRPGFSRDSRILQKERVAVFVTAPLTKDSPEGGKS